MFLFIGWILFFVQAINCFAFTKHFDLILQSFWLDGMRWPNYGHLCSNSQKKKKGKTKKSSQSAKPYLNLKYFTVLTFPSLASLMTRWSTNGKRKDAKIYMTDSLRPRNLFWLFATRNLLLATVLYLSVSQALRQWVKCNEWDWESLGDSSWHANSLSLTLAYCTALLSVALVNVGGIYVSWGDSCVTEVASYKTCFTRRFVLLCK